MKKSDFIIRTAKEYSVEGKSRYVIMAPDTERILDDVEGYGYSSYKAALKCARYKIGNHMQFQKKKK